MKRILVPCDFSAPSREAYKFALQLAKATAGEIFVVHVISFPVMYESTFGVQPYPLDTQQIKRMEDNAGDAFNKLKKEDVLSDQIPVTFLLLYDYLLPAITTFVEKKQIDLVVMGTSGSSGMEEFFIGSNTEKVVRFSTVPVISLHRAPVLKSLKSIVVPTNLELNQTDFITRVKTLQDFFAAKLHLLWINSPRHFKTDNDAKNEMAEFCRHYKLENCTLNIRNSPKEKQGIIDFVHEIGGDMLAMATHGRKGLAHLFSGSITESVVNHIDCPIWTYVVGKK